ncbi:MAG: DUF6452 family protein [Bacteroidota bacterium]
MNHRLIPFLFCITLAACSPQDICDDDSQSILVARFRTLVGGKITDTIVPGISILGIREGKSDSLLYNSVSVGRAELPLDPSNNQSVFVIRTAEKNDTLFVMHSSEAYLISYNCGFAARFTLEDFTSTGRMILNIELIEAIVDAELESNEEHLWIYF